MKKLFVLIAAAAFIAPASLFAQDVKVTRSEDENTITVVEETPTATGKVVTTTVMEKNSVFTNGFWHNWQLSLGLGTQMYYGDNDWKVAKKIPEMWVFPTVDLYLTKWVSPSFGVGLGANWAPFKGLYQSKPGHSNNPREINANFRDPNKVTLYDKADHIYDSEGLAIQNGGSYLDVFVLRDRLLCRWWCHLRLQQVRQRPQRLLQHRFHQHLPSDRAAPPHAEHPRRPRR